MTVSEVRNPIHVGVEDVLRISHPANKIGVSVKYWIHAQTVRLVGIGPQIAEIWGRGLRPVVMYRGVRNPDSVVEDSSGCSV